VGYTTGYYLTLSGLQLAREDTLCTITVGVSSRSCLESRSYTLRAKSCWLTVTSIPCVSFRSFDTNVGPTFVSNYIDRRTDEPQRVPHPQWIVGRFENFSHSSHADRAHNTHADIPTPTVSVQFAPYHGTRTTTTPPPKGLVYHSFLVSYVVRRTTVLNNQRYNSS
jgi:hypothetical protein